MVKGLTYKRMMHAALPAVITAGAFAMPAAAQIRVDAPIHSSYDSCPSCDLSNKRLNGIRLENANFAGSLFNGSNLSGGHVHSADMTDTHFKKALFYGFEGEHMQMTGAVLEDATLTEASITNSILHKSDFSRANMSRANFSNNDFRAANLTDSKAVNTNFTGSDFEGTKLDDSNLQDANLTDGIFKSASFGKAILLGSQMQGANLTGADLSRVQGLSQAQLDTACGDTETQLPDGLFIPFCVELIDDRLSQTISSETITIQAPSINELTQGSRTQNRPAPLQDTPILGFDQRR